MKFVLKFVHICDSMASTEIEALKIIWDNKGKASLSKIEESLELRFNLDYIRLICQGLIKKKFVEFSDGQYKITGLGKKELEKSVTTETQNKKETQKKIPSLSASEASSKIQSSQKKVAKPKKEIVVKKVTKKVKKKEIKETPITGLIGLTPKLMEELKGKGFRTLEDVATTSLSRFMETIKGLGLKKAADMINEARAKLKKEGKEYLWEEK